MGNLTEAAKLGRHNLALLSQDTDDAPIIFLEPSCYSMFVEDYRELKLPEMETVARRCFLFEEFIADLLRQEPRALLFDGETHKLVIHAHCHAKSLASTSYSAPARRTSAEPDSGDASTAGCCGMAGAFGMMESKYELSLKVAEPLIENQKPALRNHRGGVGHQLPASNPAPRHKPDTAHGLRAG